MAKTSSGAGLGCVWRGWWSAYGAPLVAKFPELGCIPYSTTFEGWGPRPFGSVSKLCVFKCLGGGLGSRSSGSLWCSGAGVPSYLAARGSLGAFPWFAPLSL